MLPKLWGLFKKWNGEPDWGRPLSAVKVHSWGTLIPKLMSVPQLCTLTALNGRPQSGSPLFPPSLFCSLAFGLKTKVECNKMNVENLYWKGDVAKLNNNEKITDITSLKNIAKEVRKDILLEIYSAQSGHPGRSIVVYRYFSVNLLCANE